MEEKKVKHKMGSIPWHKQKIKELQKLKSKAGKKGSKAKLEKHHSYKEGYGNTYKTTTKKPPARYRSRVEYDFLKYIRVVFRWAVDNSGLPRPQIELLLYLYGLGAFSMKQFNDYHKLVGMYAIKSLKRFEDEGWVKVWRVRKGKQHKLYTLTHKGKMLCNKMHRYACGVDEIPENPVSNKMMRKDAPRINNYYMDIIKRMNSDKASS